MNPNIFPYTDAAGASRLADPLLIDHRLRCALGDLEALVADFYNPDPAVQHPACDALADAVCDAFELGTPFDMATQQGEVTMGVWSKALFSWQEWMEKNADGASGSATCSKPTESAPARDASCSASNGTTASP